MNQKRAKQSRIAADRTTFGAAMAAAQRQRTHGPKRVLIQSSAACAASLTTLAPALCPARHKKTLAAQRAKR
jgi:hypothetical protein